ncbi:MAG TPA: MarR family transcriptional regulator [Polyangiales bacterium]|nr:MarR family transcriptional regulator [Polyangiales bacterium]
MSTEAELREFERVGLGAAEAAAVGAERAAQVRAFRLTLVIAQELRYLTDQLYRAEGLTTQQATLLTVVRTRGQPSLSEVASALFTSHQNVKQLVAALQKKGFVRLVVDKDDARVRRVVTTAKNEKHWARRNPDDFVRVGEWFAELDADETAQLARLLAKLQSGLRPLAQAEEKSGSPKTPMGA